MKTNETDDEREQRWAEERKACWQRFCRAVNAGLEGDYSHYRQLVRSIHERFGPAQSEIAEHELRQYGQACRAHGCKAEALADAMRDQRKRIQDRGAEQEVG